MRCRGDNLRKFRALAALVLLGQWKARNDYFFQGMSQNSSVVIQVAMARVQEYMKANMLKERDKLSGETNDKRIKAEWKPP